MKKILTKERMFAFADAILAITMTIRSILIVSFFMAVPPQGPQRSFTARSLPVQDKQ